MTWETSYQQWVSWVAEEAVGDIRGPLDEFDDALCSRLDRTRFPGAHEDTVVSGNAAAPGADASAAAPDARSVAGQLEVGLVSAPPEDRRTAVAGQLEVHLETPDVEGLYIPTLTRSGSTPPTGLEMPAQTGQTVVAPAPSPVQSEPTAVPEPVPPASTTTPAVPLAVSPSEATPPEPMPVPSPVVAHEGPPLSADSGEFGADQAASSSQTAGEIVSLDDVKDDFDPGSSVTGGKIVVNTSLSESVLDEEEVDEEEVDEEDLDEEEADEIDASDLVEEAEPPPPPQASPEPKVPPPAPAPADRGGGGEPSLATRAALAELQAEAGLGGQEAGPRPWYEEVFEDHYAALTRPTLRETAEAEARFFVETAGLAGGAHVLDMGCGQGAHAIALAKSGFAVTGVDLSLAQLLRASQAKDAAGLSVAFLQGDMRDPPVQGPFEGVLCVGSTLGYFSDEENLDCLRRMHEMLTPGGKLLIEVFNRDHIISRLPARSWWQGRGCLVLDEAHMDYFSNRLLVHRTAVFEDGRQFEHHIDVRAYAVHELLQMCDTVGLRVLEVSGSRCTRGRFYGATSPDIWLLTERPAQ